MERLTDPCWKNLDPWECCGQDYYCKRGCHDKGGCTNGCIVPKLYARLAAYEDIGMTPEEIKAPFTEDTMINLAAQALGVEPSRLREIAEADKDRRLVVLPCKVGDTVYFALLGRIIEKQVFSIVSFSNSTRIYWGGTSEYFRPEDIGKTVFLTREEAEKALRGMEGKKDDKT